MNKIPSDLRKALTATPKIEALWNDLTPIAQRDFINWIESAKQLNTRKRRIELACSKLLAGKRRPCCYAIVPMKLYKALDENPKAKAKWKELTPDERRDLVSWIDDDNSKAEHVNRVEKACELLASGKKFKI